MTSDPPIENVEDATLPCSIRQQCNPACQDQNTNSQKMAKKTTTDFHSFYKARQH